jgi:hypothetical protein
MPGPLPNHPRLRLLKGNPGCWRSFRSPSDFAATLADATQI